MRKRLTNYLDARFDGGREQRYAPPYGNTVPSLLLASFPMLQMTKPYPALLSR
jgi:hypothetical protein